MWMAKTHGSLKKCPACKIYTKNKITFFGDLLVCLSVLVAFLHMYPNLLFYFMLFLKNLSLVCSPSNLSFYGSVYLEMS